MSKLINYLAGEFTIETGLICMYIRQPFAIWTNCRNSRRRDQLRFCWNVGNFVWLNVVQCEHWYYRHNKGQPLGLLHRSCALLIIAMRLVTCRPIL